MSAPTREEIATLRALPTTAREALAKGTGPGWGIGNHPTDGVQCINYSDPTNWTRSRARAAGMGGSPWLTQVEGWMWLPADTAEIVKVATDSNHVGPARGWEWMAVKGFTPDRLGALHLLASVCPK